MVHVQNQPLNLLLFFLCFLLSSALFYYYFYNLPTITSPQPIFKLSTIVHAGYNNNTQFDVAYKHVSYMEDKLAYGNALFDLGFFNLLFTHTPLSLSVSTRPFKVTSDHADSIRDHLHSTNINGNFHPLHSDYKLKHLLSDTTDLRVPDVQDKQTVITLAMMANNAYTPPQDRSGWFPINSTQWKINATFGFSSNGVRGHVYTSGDSKVVVIAYKGTSPYWFGVGGELGYMDRLNDNHMFSCCCAKINSWTPTPVEPVCDCHGSGNVCGRDCVLTHTKTYNSSYYNSARVVYDSAKKMYPDSDVWFTGHSLGGVLASLMGITLGLPAVTFQSPGDHLYGGRIGLHVDEGYQYPIYHMGNDADPIYTGKCGNYERSPCYYTGYIIESKCHVGHSCVFEVHTGYDDIRMHRITSMIKDVLFKVDKMPTCRAQNKNCTDCAWWKYK